MTTKEMAREALQKLHDAYDAIPDSDSEDFDHTQFNSFAKAMETSMKSFKEGGRHSNEAQMKADALAWAKTLPDK